MQVYDGPSSENGTRMFGRYCGRLLRFTLYGTTNEMLVTAHTDKTIGKVREQAEEEEEGSGGRLGESVLDHQ